MTSFLEGRPSISRDGSPASRPPTVISQILPNFGPLVPPREVAPTESIPEPAPPTVKHGKVKIEAVEENGVVQKIVVLCACGERIEVHCGY